MTEITPDPPWPPEEPIEPPDPDPRNPHEEPPWTGDPILRGEVQELARELA